MELFLDEVLQQEPGPSTNNPSGSFSDQTFSVAWLGGCPAA